MDGSGWALAGVAGGGGMLAARSSSCWNFAAASGWKADPAGCEGVLEREVT